MGKRKFLSPYYLAEIYVGLGDCERALPLLEAAYDMRMPQLFRLRMEPIFQDLLSDRRLTAFVSRLQLKRTDS